LRAYSNIKHCRICKSQKLELLKDFGLLYLSNFIDTENSSDEQKVPLRLIRCQSCQLVQLGENTNKNLLYRDNYWYFSGITQTMRDALKDIVDKAMEHVNLEDGDTVLDIGSNDGTLLSNYPKSIKTIGFEPAQIFSKTESSNISTFINQFWNKELYHKHSKKKAKIITAIAMLYDLEDPVTFIKDVHSCLDEQGIFITQFMGLYHMLKAYDFGNICHEHLLYYDLENLKKLFNQNGLAITHIESNLVNGGSYRIYARKGIKNSSLLEKYISREKEVSMESLLHHFFKVIDQSKTEALAFFHSQKKKGKKVWVYGASTKGNMILQYFNLDSKLIEAASERTELKWGKYTVGTHIPIYSEEKARRLKPDYFLILPYAFKDEMIKRESRWVDQGGQFLKLFPSFGTTH